MYIYVKCQVIYNGKLVPCIKGKELHFKDLDQILKTWKKFLAPTYYISDSYTFSIKNCFGKFE
jgi:hypothetical protein